MEFELDLTQQVVLATSGSDGTITVPVDKPTNLGLGPQNAGSYWFLSIAGTPVYANESATATSANAVLPVGMSPRPWRLAPGKVLHFLATLGTGTVSIIRARIVN